MIRHTLGKLVISIVETWIFRWDNESNAEDIIYESRVTVDEAGDGTLDANRSNDDTPPTSSPASDEMDLARQS